MRFTDMKDPRINGYAQMAGVEREGEDITLYMSDGNEIFLSGGARKLAKVLAEMGCYCGEKLLAEINEEDERHEKGKTKAADGLEGRKDNLRAGRGVGVHDKASAMG